MELLIAGIVIGIIVAIAVTAMNKKSPESPEAQLQRNLARLDGNREELESRHQRHWLSVLDRLPIVDPTKSELLHSPIYDCVSDEFELPCLHPTYGSHCNSVQGGMLIGFVPNSEVRQTLINFSDKGDEVVAFIDAGDHAYLIWTNTIGEPGSKIYRILRTGSDEFHLYGWRSGMSPSAGKIDPPYHVRSMSDAPEAWLKRMRVLRERWALNSNYQSATRRCSHH